MAEFISSVSNHQTQLFMSPAIKDTDSKKQTIPTFSDYLHNLL